MASPALQGPLTDGVGEAVLVHDTPEPYKFSSLDSCQKKVQGAHKVVDLTPHPGVGLVLQAAGAEKFPQVLGLGSLDHFPRVSKQGP